MNRIFTALFFIVCSLMLSCAASNNYSPSKKYPQDELREDYQLLRNILEKKHPSLYWYTPKDSMDWFFDKYYQSIPDSMTEQQFAYWLQGFAELNPNPPTAEQWQSIREHLATVFKKITPEVKPAIDPSKNEALKKFFEKNQQDRVQLPSPSPVWQPHYFLKPGEIVC